MSDSHRGRHRHLHDCIDELVADYLRHHPNQLLPNLSVQQLLDWSGAQSLTPTEPDPREPNGHHNGVTFNKPHDDGTG